MQKDREILVAGIEPQSLVDEPGHVVAIIYLQQCNLNCGFCHNSSLIPRNAPGTARMTGEQIVEKLSGNFLIDGVIFTGGEPTMQPGIVDVVKVARDKFSFVGIDTNGTNPRVIEQVSPHVSRIAMDIKTTFEKYPVVAGKNVNIDEIRRSISALCRRSVNGGRVEFRTTLALPLVSADDVAWIADYLISEGFSGNFNSRYVIQQYVASAGVRPGKIAFETMTAESIHDLASEIKKQGIPVATRCQF